MCERIFDRAFLAVVHTNVQKSSEQTNVSEVERKLRSQLTPAYDALKIVCVGMDKSLRNMINESRQIGWRVKEIDDRWKEVITRLGQARGLGIALGFTFAVAEEIIGQLRSQFALLNKNGHFDGKPSGAGTGGNLVVAGWDVIEEKRNAIFEAVSLIRDRHNQLHRHPLGTPSSISVMYDTFYDGFESGGLRLERSKL